ncbi:unnamed protein product [Lampetra fluviatilis]
MAASSPAGCRPRPPTPWCGQRRAVEPLPLLLPPPPHTFGARRLRCSALWRGLNDSHGVSSARRRPLHGPPEGRQGPARHPPREPPVEREQLAARLGLQIARRATKAARIEGPHCTSDAGPGETAPPVSLSARRGAVGGAKRERRLATLAAASPGHCDVGRPRGGGGGGGEALATGGGVESAGY